MAGPQRKPQADIYTALLVIAFVAILMSILFLYLETSDYGANKYKGAPPVARLDQPAVATDYADVRSGTWTAAASTAGFRLAAIAPSHQSRISNS